MKYFIIFLFIGFSASAQIVTDRPSQTESPKSVRLGEFQLETGFAINDRSTKNSTNRQLLLPNLLFRYGISEFFELRIITNHLIINNENETLQGFSNTEVGAKVELWNSKDESTTIGILSHLILPNGNREFKNDEYGMISRLAIAKTFSNRLNISSNIGYKNADSGNGDLLYSVAFGIGVTDKFSLYLEPYGSLTELEKNQLSINGGLLYLINNNLQWDLSIGTSIDETMNFINTGLSWSVPFSAN